MKFAPIGPIDNNSALSQVVACCQAGKQAIAWTNGDIVLWCQMASLSPSWKIYNWK